ncbi:TPA: hypothetical protein ACH3X2_013510 [Trebouxia sp. C0005]
MASHCAGMSATTPKCLHSAHGTAPAVAPCRSLGRKAFNGQLVNSTVQRRAARTLRTACRAAVDVTSGTFPPPLVGNEAPDFLAQAVFDQEFVEVSLSQYRVSSRVIDSVTNISKIFRS